MNDQNKPEASELPPKPGAGVFTHPIFGQREYYTADQMDNHARAAIAMHLAEWEKLKDPIVLHRNLLRGFPARLTPDMLRHIAGDFSDITMPQSVSNRGEKPTTGPGGWFSVDVLGNPMREYAPDKWEGCIWPSAAAEPKLVLALPDYDKRQIVIASDEVIDGERLVCVAIKDGAAEPVPTDLSKQLRNSAVWGRVTLSKEVVLAAADEIESYYGGMMAWKRTAEAKDVATTIGEVVGLEPHCEAVGVEYAAQMIFACMAKEAGVSTAWVPGGNSHKQDDARRLARYILAAPAAPTDAKPLTYSSTQATICAGCGKHKHTPLRIDAMDGYVCLTCIDNKLGSLLGEFGYAESDAAPTDAKHPDDLAVDRFAVAMKEKMAKQRAKGYGGWDDPKSCSVERLQGLLIEHLPKGDPVDVGNFAMMLFNRGAATTRWRTVPPSVEELAEMRALANGYVRSMPTGQQALAMLRRAMDDAKIQGLERGLILGYFSNEWNKFFAAATAPVEPPIDVTKIDNLKDNK